MFFIEPEGLIRGTQQFRDNPDGIEGHTLFFLVGKLLCNFSASHIQLIDIYNYKPYAN